MTRNWDTETADRCRLPEMIPNICDDCRDYKYCYRQLSFDFGAGEETGRDKGKDK